MREKTIVTCFIFVLLISVVRIDGQSQTPILDQVANKVIQKYQAATCQQLWAERAQKAPPTPAEQRAIQFLKTDPQMRTAFLNKSGSPHRQQDVRMRNDSVIRDLNFTTSETIAAITRRK